MAAPIWNVVLPVVALVRADTAEAATEALREALTSAGGWEIYDVDDLGQPFKSDDQTVEPDVTAPNS